MKQLLAWLALAALWARTARGQEPDSCPAEPGPWGELLEQWALSAPALSNRQGRIMALPPAPGYYVTDRVDRPPPPPHGPHPPQHGPHPPHHGPHPSQGPFPYDEWQDSSPPPGKVVNRPPKPYKDKFKPSYPDPQPPHQQSSYPAPPPHQQSSYPAPAPPHQQPSYPPPAGSPHRGPGLAADRVDEPAGPPPRKQVSETDLYLLSAIEKLVYRVDLMEKRLRRMEENMHYLVAGKETKPEPCAANFTRVGAACYHVSAEAADWKAASLACRRLRAPLLELDAPAERRTLAAALLNDKRIRGEDIWTGGLNPGLLWIWAHSARPVAGNTTNTSSTIVGDGRCLALVHDPAINNYVYRGQDCGLRHRYICEKEEDKTVLSNEVSRVSRELRALLPLARRDSLRDTTRDSSSVRRGRAHSLELTDRQGLGDN